LLERQRVLYLILLAIPPSLHGLPGGASKARHPEDLVRLSRRETDVGNSCRCVPVRGPSVEVIGREGCNQDPGIGLLHGLFVLYKSHRHRSENPVKSTWNSVRTIRGRVPTENGRLNLATRWPRSSTVGGKDGPAWIPLLDTCMHHAQAAIYPAKQRLRGSQEAQHPSLRMAGNSPMLPRIKLSHAGCLTTRLHRTLDHVPLQSMLSWGFRQHPQPQSG
jgi:hypothetical protein